MKPDVEAFFTEQDECMNVVDEDFQDFLTQTASPATPLTLGKGASTSLNPVPEGDSSIKAPKPSSDTASKAHEDLSSNLHEVSSSKLPRGSKRRGDALLSSPAAKKRKNSKETKLSSSPIGEHSSPRAARTRQKRASKPSSKPANLQLGRADSTSSIEEITSAVFLRSAGLGSKASRLLAQESHSDEVEPTATDVIPAVAGPSHMIPPPSGDHSSGLALQMASRVASLTHKNAQPRVHKAKARHVQDKVPVSVSTSASSRLPSPSLQARTSAKNPKKTPPQKGLPKRPAVKPAKKPTPEEYARHLLEKRKLDEDNPAVVVKPVVKFLLGMNIFYYGGEYDTASDPNKVITLKEFWEFPAYLDRFEAGTERSSAQRQKGGRALSKAPGHTLSFKVDRNEEDFDSDREEFGPIPGPSSVNREDRGAAKASSSSESRVGAPQVFKPSSDDPLAEFYAQATAEHREQWSRHGEVDANETDDSDSEGSEDEEVAQKTTKTGNWACDKPGPNRCPNQLIVDKFSELEKLHEAKFDRDNFIRAVKAYPTPIKSHEEAAAIKGVGPKSAEKIWEIISTGELRRIYGVGPTTAIKWYYNGARTLEDVSKGKYRIKLSEAQRIGLDNYNDINSRMPREEARAIFDLIKPIALDIDPKLFVEIMGSYRRGKADCGDIDIMITREHSDGKTHAGVLAKLLQKLHDVGILTDDLALPENPWDLEAIYRGLCHLPKEGSRKRRIDFLTVPWKSRGAALLYYTGDDIFNRAMRLKANHAGYSLNQKGLFEGVIRNPSNRTIKLDTGVLRASETEEEIFEILKVPWQAPHQRVRNFY
ncbi:hypothetical protein BDZ89DRAFT_1127214 [Hymenopellis radicata]|nr:hypothetical protein BDZ89DRAFT_1127214 [Hymenopellis radicata]